MTARVRQGLLLLLLLGALMMTPWSRPLTAPVSGNVYLEDLTWVEVREAIHHGKTTAIVPTGGTEQNGPHVVLGKHNYIVHYTAGEIGRALGNALVAPVVAYVPEGSIEPPEGHMLLAGTISVSEEVFAAILESTARSLRAHGFTTILFIGDSGGNQETQARVADRLNAEWAGSGVRALQVGDYYYKNGQVDWLLAQGETRESIGTHAGIRDTSELMVVDPEGVRMDRLAPQGGNYTEPTGVAGDPTRASADRGRKLLRLKIEAALAQIRRELGAAGS